MINKNSEKWIIGTGFSRGIGFELAKHIKANGFKILHIGRTKSEFDDEFLECDLSKEISESTIQTLNGFLKEKICTGYIYCAGIIPALHPTEDAHSQALYWKSQSSAMQVNYLSCIQLLETLLPHLKSNKQGPFVAHLSSLAAVDPLPNFEMYGISKLATLKYFSYLSKDYLFEELGCYSIHPGTVKTDILNNIMNDEAYQNLPIIKMLHSMQAENFLDSVQAANNIYQFLFTEEANKLRQEGHGQLFLTDQNKCYRPSH